MSVQPVGRWGRAGRGQLRRWVAGAGVGAVVLAGSLVSGAAAVAAPTPGPEQKIQAEVGDELAEHGRATVLVRFGDRPDLTAFDGMTAWEERGQAVYDALRTTAERSQADTRAELDRGGVGYRSFFISNSILVRGGDQSLLTALALDPGVEGVYLPTEYDLPEPVVSEPIFTPDAVEWGIANVNADDVWAGYGVTGEEIVVANIDTGVDYTHPALVEQYRGNNGDGTFTHDYNWFDAGGTGSDEPVDIDAHGTHTMGTMVGSDGGSNQIGVAPGARWIAANGCCPSDVALISSGEWLLAPTDLAGDNPRPDLRPHIINNSWGGGAPINDPFMDDVAEAWAAAGIFGVWANGNSGPDCQTSEPPGGRVINYSVGAYDVANTIASFSSRGAGQDGQVKPDIAAPGVAVRSSVPGGGYEAFDGTSMAAPHVAGSVALLWSAAPDLIGDVTFTRELLDGSAVDTADDQCGGTDDDNNVYGEGRLDALALLDLAPIGDSGRVTGTVTDAATDEALSGATVRFEAERTRTVSTATDGTYGVRLSSGDWDSTVEKFGYLPDTAPVTVPVDATVVRDAALEQAPTGVLSGTVTDGSGQDYPLYARISVVGVSGVGAYTDPMTGDYELVLPVGTHVVRATSQLPGYLTQTREVIVEVTETTTADFALEVDTVSCTAPGYQLVLDGVSESFDSLALPAGWAVEDLIGGSPTWEFEDPLGFPNDTGGAGGFAVANSLFHEVPMDTVLVSPVVDASAMANVTVSYQQLFDTFGFGVGAVEVSADGGTTWTRVHEVTSFVFRDAELLDVSAELAGSSQAQVRFRYTTTELDLLWQVDDAFFGSRTCEPVGGGLVVGYVQDDIDGSAILNARVSSVDNPSDSGITRATPDDPALDDGFYWLQSDLVGTHPFLATARNYGTDEQDVTVEDGGVVRADFVLGQAILDIDPTALETSLQLGESDSGSFTVTNTGTSTAEITFTEVRGGFQILRADGTRMTSQQAASSEGAPLVERTVDRSISAFADGQQASAAGSTPPRTAEEPWTDLAPLPRPLLDNRLVSLEGNWYSIGGGDGSQSFADVYRYDAVALEWTAVAPLPAPTQLPMAEALDGRLVVAGGWQDGDPTSDTWVYDPGTDVWSAGAPMPQPVSSMGVAVAEGEIWSIGGCTTAFCLPIVDTVQSYDVAGDTWSVHSPLPTTTAFPACGGVDGGIVCAGGVNDAEVEMSETWSYDPATDTWSEAAPAPVALFAPAAAAANAQLIVVSGIQDGQLTNASWSYDPVADAWSPLPRSNEAVYRGGGACGFVRGGGDTGGFLPTDSVEMLPGFDVCDAAGADVEWIELDTTEAVLAPGESVTVGVTMDSAAVNQPGTYTAGVGLVANVPVRPAPVQVTMHVAPPLTWGKVMGTAYLEDCGGGQVAGDSVTIDIAPVRQGVGDGWVIFTDAEGTYARWINTQLGTLRMTAVLGGYRPDTHLVDLARGGTVTRDFSMREQACQENPGPVPPDVERIAGLDRYDTSTKISQKFAAGVDTVFVATGRDFPDALGAAARAGSLGGPVLLVRPDSVPDPTRIELNRLQPDTVVVVGGTGAVSAGVERSLSRLLPDATVTRRGGADRYQTAARIASDVAAAEVVFVATGRDFPDALAGAARAGSLDAPVLLVRQDSVPTATRTQLARLSPERIVVLGGTGAVSRAVATQLGAYGTVERVAGVDRYATAAAVAKQWTTSQDVYVASGLAWPDALAGAARAGATDSPLLLVRKETVPAPTLTELDRLDPGRVFVLGGLGVIGEAVVERLRTLE